jgi:DNA polymerase
MSQQQAREQLDHMHRRIRRCTACPLHRSRTHAVPGEGDCAARVMFVGEAPGAQEDEVGRPFVGPSGRFLDELLAEYNLRRDAIFITSSVKCRPPGNRPPHAEELAICKQRWLVPQIELINPRVIVLLGAVAVRQVLGWTGELRDLHGRTEQLGGRICAITYHPAAGMRFPDVRRTMRQDFRQFSALLRRAAM